MKMEIISLKLSELNPEKIELVKSSGKPLKLSKLKPEDISLVNPEEVSQLEAIARSGFAGATADLSIPIEAGYKALIRKIQEEAKNNILIDPSLKEEIPLSRLYQEERKKVGEALKTGEEAYPSETTIASFGGGALAALIPGGAAVKTVKAAEKLPLLARMGKGAWAGLKAGTTYGGLSGAIRSEADITEGMEAVPQIVEDTAKGAGVGLIGGTVLGGALPAVREGIARSGKWAIEKGKDLPFVHLPVKAFESELKGEKIPWSLKALSEAGENIAKEVESLGGKIDKLQDKYGKRVGRALTLATKKGATSDYGPALAKAREELVALRPNVTAKAAKEIDGLINEIDNRLEGELKKIPITKEVIGKVGEEPILEVPKTWKPGEPAYKEKMQPVMGIIPEETTELARTGGRSSGPIKEMEQYRQTFKQQTPVEGREFESPTVKKIISGTAKEMKEADEKAIADVSERLGEFYKKAKSGYSEILGSEFTGTEPLKDLIPTSREIQDLTAGKKNAGEVLHKLNKFFERFQKVAPKMAESERKAFEELSNKFNLLAARSGQATLISPGAGLAERALGFAGVGGGALVGRAARFGMNTAQAIIKSPERVSQILTNKYGDKAKPLVNILNTLSSRDNVGKNALMFSIMQNPQYREMLHSASPDEMKNE